MRRLYGAAELLDGPLDVTTLEGNLRDIARVNRWLDGAGLTRRALKPIMGEVPSTRRISILDVGTGGGDIPRSLARAAARDRRDVHIVATDVRPEIVSVAKRTTADTPQIEVKTGLPDRIEEHDGSFDIVHASMVLHHLEPPAAIALLREMARVAKRAVIVNDLNRSQIWLLAAQVLTRLTTTNRYTRNDAPLSVRRAYKPSEVVRLALSAGLVEERRHRAWPGYRYALVFTTGARKEDR